MAGGRNGEANVFVFVCAVVAAGVIGGILAALDYQLSLQAYMDRQRGKPTQTYR